MVGGVGGGGVWRRGGGVGGGGGFRRVKNGLFGEGGRVFWRVLSVASPNLCLARLGALIGGFGGQKTPFVGGGGGGVGGAYVRAPPVFSLSRLPVRCLWLGGALVGGPVRERGAAWVEVVSESD